MADIDPTVRDHLRAWRDERRSVGSIRALTQRARETLGVTEISAWTTLVNERLDRLELARAEEQRRVDVLEFTTWLEHAELRSERAVSVIMPTRNRAERVRTAIESVQRQHHHAWELIVVDDGSTDTTPAVLAEFEPDMRIQTFRSKPGGSCAARNRGLRAASGSIVTYLDDDNVMLPHWLSAVVWAFDRAPELDVLYGARIIDSAKAVGLSEQEMPTIHFRPFDRAALRRGNTTDVNVLAHRRDLPEASFDEELSRYGDWDLFLRLTEQDEPLALPAIACIYTTVSTERLTHAPGDAEEKLQVLEKHRRRNGSPPGTERPVTERGADPPSSAAS